MKYTQTEITNAISKLQCALGNTSNREVLNKRYGLNKSYFLEMNKQMGLLVGFSFYEQNSNGTTTGFTNYWSEDDVTNIMNYISKL